VQDRHPRQHPDGHVFHDGWQSGAGRRSKTHQSGRSVAAAADSAAAAPAGWRRRRNSAVAGNANLEETGTDCQRFVHGRHRDSVFRLLAAQRLQADPTEGGQQTT